MCNQQGREAAEGRVPETHPIDSFSMAQGNVV